LHPISAGAVTRKGRAVSADRAACADKPVLFAQAALFTIGFPHVLRVSSLWQPYVFSFLGVLAISLALLVVVVLTAGLILGK
jgi:hypothetical protein